MAEEQTKKQDEQTEQEAPQLTVNVVSVEDAGTLKKKVKVEVPREEIDKRLNENFMEMTRNAQIPGFRVGRAPRRLIEKRFSKRGTRAGSSDPDWRSRGTRTRRNEAPDPGRTGSEARRNRSARYGIDDFRL